MTTIFLPFGGELQTDGIIYQSGAYVHLIDKDGEIAFRAIHQEFGAKPQETMQNLLEALEEFVPNTSEKDKEYHFRLDNALLIGNKKKIQVLETRGSQAPLIEYSWKDWQKNPEEVIGAIINCIHAQHCPKDTEQWENNEDE